MSNIAEKKQILIKNKLETFFSYEMKYSIKFKKKRREKMNHRNVIKK
jgi:hypothetical protein